MKALRIFLVFVGLFALLPLHSVQAQSCTNVTILNQTDQTLDTNKICEAGAKWVAKGLNVYVWVTAKMAGSTEQEWLSMRDATESAWGIYNPANDTFSTSAVAVELSVDTSQAWGQDFAFGEMLFGTALDSDPVVAGLESNLKQKVAGGDLTAAIVETLNAAYEYVPANLQQARPAAAASSGSSSSSQSGSSQSGSNVGAIILVVLAAGGFLLLKLFGIDIGSGGGGGGYHRSGGGFRSSGGGFRSSGGGSRGSMGSSRRR